MAGTAEKTSLNRVAILRPRVGHNSKYSPVSGNHIRIANEQVIVLNLRLRYVDQVHLLGPRTGHNNCSHCGSAFEVIDRSDRYHSGIDQFVVQSYEGIALQLGQRQILGVIGLCPTESVGQLPCPPP